MPNPRLLMLLAPAAGALAALGFAPWGLWPLTIVGAGLLVAMIDAAPGRRWAALFGWLWGVGHFGLGLTWIATAFTFQAKMPPLLGWVAVGGLAMFLSIYVALAAVLTRALAKGPLARVLALAAAFMLGEWLRGWVLSGFAWDPLGTAWLEAPGVAQLARFGGSLALSGVMIVAGGALWLVYRGKDTRVAGAIAGGLVVLAGVAGAMTMVPAGPGGPTIYLVQPNIGQDEKYEAGAADAHFGAYLDMTAAALRNRASTKGAIVMWSESSVPYLVEEEPRVRAALASVLGPDDLLLFGGVAAIRDGRGELTALTNSLYVIDARGRIHGRYDKAHLVPLGEYVPARELMTRIGLARLAPGDLDFMPGPGPRTLTLPGFPAVGGQICYEIIFPGAVVDRAHRPAWIATISNDAWFGPTGPPQHLAQARLRAIEEGLPIARVTPTGISAMIDAQGRLSAQIGPGVRGVTSGILPPPLPETLFARFGHGASAVFGLLMLLAGVIVDRRRANISII